MVEKKTIIFTSLLFLFFFAYVEASQSNGEMTWVTGGSYTLSVTLLDRNMSQPGTQNISVIVESVDTVTGIRTYVTNATVNGTIIYPNATVDYNFPFLNHSNGSYSNNYPNFTTNGSFWIDVDVTEPSIGGIDVNDTIVVGYIINNFTIAPTSVAQNVPCTFAVTICNSGTDSLTNVTTRLRIYNSSWALQRENNLTSGATFFARDCQILTTQITFTGYPVGQYWGQINVSYNESSAHDLKVWENETFNITVATTPPVIPPPAGGGGGGAGIARESAVSIGLGFKKHPMLVEVPSGQEVIIDTVVINLTDKPKTLRSLISGVPKEWIMIQDTMNMEVKAGESKTVSVILDIPKDIVYGDYFITNRMRVGSGITEPFFLLRVKYYPEDYDKPMVFRKINTNFVEGTTEVKINVINPKTPYKYVEVIEEIPKSLAYDVNSISFGTSPTEVLRADPKVSWMILEFRAEETEEITYTVNTSVDEYEPYVYWPVEQVNIMMPGVPEKLKITEVFIPTLTTGTENEASFLLTNTYPMALDVKLEFGIPYGWKTDPEEITIDIGPHSSTNVSFLIIPWESAKKGTYTMTIKNTFNFGTTTKEIPVIVEDIGAGFAGCESGIGFTCITGLTVMAMPWVGGILSLVVLFYAGRCIYKRKSVVNVLREDRRETLDRIRELAFRKK